MDGAEIAVMDTLDWASFVDSYWDRKPVLIRNVGRAPFVEDEVFEAAMRGAATPYSAPMPAHIQFTVDRWQQRTPGDRLPRPSDRTFDGYQNRLAEALPGRRYALVVHKFHHAHHPQWRRQVDFYEDLWRLVGLPLSGAITTMFHGTYDHSPVGAHKDRFATFMYGLRGRKRMRFWASRPWTQPVSSVLDYQRYLHTSFATDVAAGELLYWPSSYYHVGENLIGEPATSVNVGVPREEHHASYDLEDLFPGPMAGDAGTEAGGADPCLPPRLAAAVNSVRTAAHPDTLARHVVNASLRRLTSGGFAPAPAPEPIAPLPDSTLVSANTPVMWATADGRRWYAANGHVGETSLPADALTRLADLLRGGTPVKTGNLVDEVATSHHDGHAETDRTRWRTEAHAVIRNLASFRALTVQHVPGT